TAGSLTVIGNALPNSALFDIQGGTLDLSGASSTTLTLASGQVLRGAGLLRGALTVSDATNLPGVLTTNALNFGRLTMSNAVTFTTTSTNIMEITVAGTGTNDTLVSSNSIALNGVLRVVTNGIGG